MVVNVVFAEGCIFFRIERIITPCASLNHVAFVKLDTYLTRYVFLRLIYKRGQRFTQGGVPLTVVNEFREAYGKFLLLVGSHFVKAKGFQVVVREVENRTARGFVYTTALHAYQTVFNDVQKTDTVFTANLIQCVDDVLCAHLFAVECNGYALYKFEFDVGRLIRSLQRRNAHFQEAFLFVQRFVACIFQVQTFVRQVPKVLVLRIVGFTVDLQRHVVCFRIFDFFFTGPDRPFTPRSDNVHVGRKCFDGKLETNLVVTLTRTAVANCVSTFFQCDFNNTLCDDGTCKRRAKHIFFVKRTCLYRGNYVFVHEFVRQVFYIQLRSARLDCLFFKAFQFVRLTNVARYCNNFTVVIVFLQPRYNDRRIQTARIRENYFFNVFLVHVFYPPMGTFYFHTQNCVLLYDFPKKIATVLCTILYIFFLFFEYFFEYFEYFMNK